MCLRCVRSDGWESHDVLGLDSSFDRWGYLEVVELAMSNLVLGFHGEGLVDLGDALKDPVGSLLGFYEGLGIGC